MMEKRSGKRTRGGGDGLNITEDRFRGDSAREAWGSGCSVCTYLGLGEDYGERSALSTNQVELVASVFCMQRSVGSCYL